ncbi:MAG: KH domain-containing protein [Chlamydiota bacterium]
MKDFIEYLIKNIVNQPDSVKITVKEENKKSLVEIRVAPEDVGKIVGKKGRVIHSLRTIAMSIGMRLGQKIQLEIIQE